MNSIFFIDFKINLIVHSFDTFLEYSFQEQLRKGIKYISCSMLTYPPSLVIWRSGCVPVPSLLFSRSKHTHAPFGLIRGSWHFIVHCPEMFIWNLLKTVVLSLWIFSYFYVAKLKNINFERHLFTKSTLSF